MSDSRFKIFIVDQRKNGYDPIARILEDAGYDLQEYTTADDFLVAYAADEPACLILHVPTCASDAAAVQEHLRARGAWLPIIVVSTDGDVANAVRAMKAGVVDFILEPFRDDDLLVRTRGALAIARHEFHEARERSSFEARLRLLTVRERQILRRLLEGKPTKIIAEDLSISQKTVEVHRYHLLRKMGATSSIQLAARAGRFWHSVRNTGWQRTDPAA